MSQTRYCSTCGALLPEGAAICGECGARYQASPYEKRATEAPGAWSQPPRPRSRDLGAQGQRAEEADEGIELISPESLTPKEPGATALRSEDQYDRMMVTQPPMHQPGPTPGMPGGPGSPASAPAEPSAASSQAPSSGAAMEPPLDGCAPATPLKRFLAALVDSVIASLVMVPFVIGLTLILSQLNDPQSSPGLLPQILIGVGAALPAAYHVLMIWLVGAKGFTLGKLILGLRVTRGSQGGQLGFVRALGRWFLYGLIPLIMALSIFLDPKKHLRGFHDRAVDSVVVDIKAGRDPLKPRPDDFERAGAEHYLGASSVPVSAHQNLLATPGAAWSGQQTSGQDAAAQPSAGSAAEQIAPSPYAPPAPSGPSASADPFSAASATDAPAPTSSDGTGWASSDGSGWGSPSVSSASSAQTSDQFGAADGGWAPPSTDPVPAAPEEQAPSWGQPAPEQQSWYQPAPQEQQWGQPAPEQQWGQPAPQEQSWDQLAPQEQQWNQPAQEQQWNQPAPHDSAPAAWGPPPVAPEHQVSEQQAPQEPVGSPWTGGATSEITGDAWDGGADPADDAVDEQTRMSAPADLGDLEATRISPMRLPAVKKTRLTADDGTERIVEKAVVIGRNPSSQDGEVLFVLKDDSRSVSKTHLRLDGTGDEVTVTDLGSTNGSTILREDGSRENLVPGAPTVLPTGAQLTLGDRTLSVEREQ